MSRLILFNKPYNVLCKFTDNHGRRTLADFVHIPNIYPAGRLDYDSEGLLLLTDNGRLQHLISDPKHKLPKTYLVQVENIPNETSVACLREGVLLQDGITRPARVEILPSPNVPERIPPIRRRENIPTCWLRLTITEGRNRQVRRMTAAVGHPTLRLIRQKIGPWRLGTIAPGEWMEVPLPENEQDFRRLLRSR